MMKYFSVDDREFYCTGRLVKICGLVNAWYETVEDPEALVSSLKKVKQRLHVFTFFQRVPHTVPKYNYSMELYSVAVMRLKTYDNWWQNRIGKKTRHAVKKAQKHGVVVRIIDFDDKLVEGISDIYNETPVRQGKKFPHYKDSLEKVRKENETFIDRSVFLGAYYQNELVGFAKIVFEDEFVDILQLLSKIAHRDKCITNALVSKIVEVCALRGVGYIAYGGYDANSLGDFKRHNDFIRMDLPRYLIPLTWAGSIALRMNLHNSPLDLLPNQMVLLLKSLRRRFYELTTAHED
jgi:hypothetical protein